MDRIAAAAAVMFVWETGCLQPLSVATAPLDGTSNLAEVHGALLCLRRIKEEGLRRCTIELDSRLAVQWTLAPELGNPELRRMVAEVREALHVVMRDCGVTDGFHEHGTEWLTRSRL